ncbi:MAG: rhodanese-like domain-containing protein [Desulfovibrionaceae bacterium]|jgi:rhodanese-related sulfurtransferase|nr:rhodanese-like domain-containing protein [Desulfovibrionaceae bacterium]
MDWLLLALILFLVLWDPFWRLLGVRQLFPWELKRILREHPESVRLVDVRTDLEHALVRIPGAISDPALEFARTPVGGDASSSGAAPLPGDASLSGNAPRTVVVCMTGHRSPLAAWLHRRATGRETWNLTWGMVGWLLFGGPSAFGRPKRDRQRKRDMNTRNHGDDA